MGTLMSDSSLRETVTVGEGRASGGHAWHDGIWHGRVSLARRRSLLHPLFPFSSLLFSPIHLCRFFPVTVIWMWIEQLSTLAYLNVCIRFFIVSLSCTLAPHPLPAFITFNSAAALACSSMGAIEKGQSNLRAELDFGVAKASLSLIGHEKDGGVLQGTKGKGSARE